MNKRFRPNDFFSWNKLRESRDKSVYKNNQSSKAKFSKAITGVIVAEQINGMVSI